MDYTNKALGLRVQTQIPLDVKTYKESEEDLKNLGLNNNLAFTYQKGLIIYCIQEGTRWEWKEVEDNDITLLPNNFIYPDNIIAFGIDYSHKEYNFVKFGIFNLQDLQSVLDIGGNAVLGSESNVGMYEMTESSFYAELSNNNSDTGFISINENIAGLGSYTSEQSSTLRMERGDFEISKQFSTSQKVQINIQDSLPNSTTFLLFPAKALENNISTHILATLDDIPTIDGTETKVIDSTTTLILGNGSNSTPYKVETKNLQKSITTNYLLSSLDNNYSIKINNGATPVTITVPAGLPENFFAGFTQKGTADVTFIGSGTTITNPIGLKIKGQGYCVGLEQIGSTNSFDLMADTKS